MNDLSDLFRNFSDSVGGYWSDSNRTFYSQNPNILQRIGRTLNPLTGFGSSLGSLYDYSRQGDVTGMALSSASALPVLAYAKAIPKNLLGTTHTLDNKRLLSSLIGQLTTNELEDLYK